MGTDNWSRESWDLEVSTLDLPLADRFTISRAAYDTVTNVFVTLRFAGVAGVGEASPAEHAGESVASVTDQLEALDPREIGNPFNLEAVLEILPAGSARCALDIALHDLAGKIAQLPLCKLLGTKGRPIPSTSLTVPIGSPDRMIERARDLAHHPILKVKVGFDGDVEAVAAIREVFDGKLRIDANEGWSPAEAIERLRVLQRFDIELCEQPIPSRRHDDLQEVTRATSIPVFADEDANTAADVAALAGRVDGVNLKLRKCGGIREAMRAIAAARAHGLGVMIGCDLETGIAATAGANVAGLVDHVDLDGPLLLKEDPFPGVVYEGATLTLPDVPGLGVRGVPT